MATRAAETAPAGEPPLVEFVVRTRPPVGGPSRGDGVIVRSLAGTTWLAVVDGLGSGPLAERATNAALAVIEALDDPEVRVLQVFARVHAALAYTRGAAATILRFDERGVEFGGIGNVALRGLGGLSLPFCPVGGVLGSHCRPPRSRRLSLEPGAALLVTTDGISRRAPLESLEPKGPEGLCRVLLSQHSNPADDATVVHATFRGKGGRT